MDMDKIKQKINMHENLAKKYFDKANSLPYGSERTRLTELAKEQQYKAHLVMYPNGE